MKPFQRPSPNAAPPGVSTNTLVQQLAHTVASTGHYDELRGTVWPPAAAAQAAEVDRHDPMADFTPQWRQFFSTLESEGSADLARRSAQVSRQIRDDGITYNVYTDDDGPQRPWSLDLFPLILNQAQWQHIETGVLQRVRLLEHIMADVYGPQKLLAQGLLPPALVHGHPGYLRAMHAVQPLMGRFLHIAAFDLARGPDGHWWLVGQRTQAPSGLGYLLENRLAISAQFDRAFDLLKIQRLAGTYRALMNSLRSMSPAGADAHMALLTPGPYNETYFEHAFLARYLGLTLVEGRDLMVRDEHLYLKTLKGLVPVHGLLKRVDDAYMDPLELRADSSLGVAGLLQAIRAGHVLVANVPGSAFLESPALLGFLPALSRHLFDQELSLPALPTWWCGERAAMLEALTKLPECAIKPTYPGSSLHSSFDVVLGARQDSHTLDEWAGRVVRNPQDHTVQAYMPYSQLPVWQADSQGSTKGGNLQLRSVILRVFAVSDCAQGWRVLPGGLARVASGLEDVTSMQRGGSSVDVWTRTHAEVDRSTLLRPHLTPQTLMLRQRMVTSRAAENLFWMGRYTERAENALRLARLALECLHGEELANAPLIHWLGRLSVVNTLVLPDVPSPVQSPRVFERALIDGLTSAQHATSVGYCLRALKLAAANVRERLSQEHWRNISRAEESLFSRFCEEPPHRDTGAQHTLQILKDTSDHMAAITGAQTDRMTRDDGWRLLSIGRHIERLVFLSNALRHAIVCQSLNSDDGFDAMIDLFDNAITFHAQFQQSRDMAALVDLLVIDHDNPRSIYWVTHTLRGRLAKLEGCQPTQIGELSRRLPDPNIWNLAQLCECTFDLLQPTLDNAHDTAAASSSFPLLQAVLQNCCDAASEVSDAVSAKYFSHVGQTQQNLQVS